MDKKKTPYTVLDVPEDADVVTIKKAHRKRARQSHPDRGGDPEEFKEVQQAYMILSDPLRRKRYDETGDVDETQSSAPHAILAQCFKKVLGQLFSEARDPGSVNVVEMVRKSIRNDLSECTQKLETNQRALRMLEGILKRTKAKKEAEFVLAILKNEVSGCSSTVAQLKTAVEYHEQALKLLDDCSYDGKETAQKSGVTMMFTYGLGGVE